jgi:hypothetical protein
MKSRISKTYFVALGAFLFVNSAFGTALTTTGQANIAGTVNVTSTSISFFGPPTGTNPNTFSVNQPDTGPFTGLTGGTINNLVGATSSLVDFVIFTVPGLPVHFDLTSFVAGIGTPAGCVNTVGSICTPPGSPFTLIQRATAQVEIDLSVVGNFYTGTSASGSTPGTGLFTTQNLVPGTITAILNQVATPQGITNSYSATFSEIIPEPTTFVILGSGLMLLGFVRRKARS